MIPRCISVIAAAFAMSACATVHIEAPSKGDVEVKTHFGIVSVALKPGARNVVVESTAFGVINALDGFTVGYHSGLYAALGREDCRIVLWIRSGEQLRELNDLLRGRTADVCVVQPPTSTGRNP